MTQQVISAETAPVEAVAAAEPKRDSWLKRNTQSLRKVLAFFQGNPPAIIGTTMLMIVLIGALAAPLLATHNPNKRVARPHEAPSVEHVLGSTRAGRDVYSQLLHGARKSLAVAFGAATLSLVLAVSIGISAGYFGGKVDEVLSFLMNVFLVIPQLPLLIVLAAFLGKVGSITIALLLGITGWAWGARVIRSQAMAIRNREYILSAEVMGEKKWRIILIEILPNLISIVVGGFIGSVIYAINSEATLSILGLSDPTEVTWGTMLFWAQSSAALYVGAWWDMLVPALALAFTGGAFALINMSVDQVSNPKLKTGPHIKVWRRLKKEADRRRGLA